MLAALGLVLLLGAAPPASGPPDLPRARKELKAALQKKKWPRARELLRPFLKAELPATRLEATLLLLDVEVRALDEKAARKLAMDALAMTEGDAPPTTFARLLPRLQKTARPLADLSLALTRLAAIPKLARQVAAWPAYPAPDAVLAPDVDTLAAALNVTREARLTGPAAPLHLALALARAHAGDRGALDHLKTWDAAQPGTRKPGWQSTPIRVRTWLYRKDPQPKLLEALLRDLHARDAAEAAAAGLTAPHTRSALTHQVCTLVDARSGKGTCLAAESAAGLPRTYRDLSRTAPTPALSDAAVADAQAEYGALLEGCARRAAETDPAATGVNLELLWVVQPSGRADSLEMEPRRLRGTPLEACLRDALAVFRYPPYRSEERRVVTLSMGIRG